MDRISCKEWLLDAEMPLNTPFSLTRCIRMSGGDSIYRDIKSLCVAMKAAAKHYCELAGGMGFTMKPLLPILPSFPFVEYPAKDPEVTLSIEVERNSVRLWAGAEVIISGNTKKQEDAEKRIPWGEIFGCYMLTPSLGLGTGLVFRQLAKQEPVMWLGAIFGYVVAILYFSMSIIPFVANLIIGVTAVSPAVLAIAPNAAQKTWNEIVGGATNG